MRRFITRAQTESGRWQEIARAHATGGVIYGTAAECVPGGLIMEVGMSAFLPHSQIGNGHEWNLEKYLGQILPLKVLEMDQARRRLVVSHTLAAKAEREWQRRKLWAEIAPGQVRTGRVKRVVGYGAFVDIGGEDGLLHITEMSADGTTDPAEIVTKGQEIEVLVLRISPEERRISLRLVEGPATS